MPLTLKANRYLSRLCRNTCLLEIVTFDDVLLIALVTLITHFIWELYGYQCYSLFNLNLTQSDISCSRYVYNLRSDVTVMYWCLIVFYLVTMLGFSNYRLEYKCIIYDVSLLVVTCFWIGDANKLWRDLNMNTYEYIFAISSGDTLSSINYNYNYNWTSRHFYTLSPKELKPLC